MQQVKNNDLEIVQKILEYISKMNTFQKGYFLGRVEEMVENTGKDVKPCA